MKKTYLWLFALILIGFTACETDDEIADPLTNTTVATTVTPTFTSGTADFSTFVSLGNSLTAGFSDGSLFAKGQEVSFPNILASQFALAGGGAFTQPLVADNTGGYLVGGTLAAGPRLIFDTVNQSPVPFSGTPTTEISNISPGPYNNMGVPGAKSFHLLGTSYGNFSGLLTMPATANPYFVRMASSPSASMLSDAMAMSPTFISLWIGNNDVLGYATSGGDGSDPITPQATFDFAMNQISLALGASNAGGIVSNIPSVTDAPYFTTVPFAPLDPTNPSFGPLIPTLNNVFGLLNQVFVGLGVPERSIVFSTTGPSAVVIKDESLTDLTTPIATLLAGNPTFSAFVQSLGVPAAAVPAVAGLFGFTYGQARQADANDLLVLPSSSIIGTVNNDVFLFLQTAGLSPAVAGQFSVEGVTNPLADKWVLVPSEILEITTATAAFNQTISNLATQNDLALFDVNTFFNGVATNGFQAGNAFMTADYVTGGTFSLDGIHPSPRGYSVVANQMIGLINAKYGSTIPTVNPVDFTGLYIN